MSSSWRRYFVTAACLTRSDSYLRIAGAYGTVYKARDRVSDKIVAIKKVKLALTEDGVPMSVLREISLLKQLGKSNHPNIVRWEICKFSARFQQVCTSELTQLQMCVQGEFVNEWSSLCCKITPLCALQLIQHRPLNIDWMRGSKTVFRGLTCHKWRNFVSRHQRNYEKYLIQNYFRLLDICHGQRIDGREMNLFLVFEHVDQDLNQYIERCPPPGLAPERIKDVMWQILSGVDFLHSHRIVHR